MAPQVQMIPMWIFQAVPWEGEKTIELLNQLGAECWELVGVIQGVPDDSPVIGDPPMLLLRQLSGYKGAMADAGLVVPGMLGPRPV